MTQLTKKQKQLSVMKKGCDESIIAFARTCTSVATLPFWEFHIEILKTIKNLMNTKVVIAAPRWSGKSTVVNTIYALWSAVTWRRKYIVLVSKSESESKKQLSKIKHELSTNDMLKALYWDLLTSKNSELEIVLSNGCIITAKGASAQIRGMQSTSGRPDLILLDDIESDESAKNLETTNKLEDDLLLKGVLPALAKRWQNTSWKMGQVVYVWTLIKEDCLLDRVLKYEKWWKQLKYSAIKDDWTALFPELYRIWPSDDPNDPREDLLEIKQNLVGQGKLNVWLSEYMNQYAASDDGDFIYEWFKNNGVTEEEVWDKDLKYYIAVDLAISQKETADYTVIIVVWIDKYNNMYVVDVSRWRYDPWKTIDEIFRLAGQWRPKKIGIESVGYQKGLIYFVQDEMKRRNVFHNVVELKTWRGSKEERIRSSLQARYRAGSIFHNKEISSELESELLSFPNWKHDDLPDALAYIPFLINPYKKKRNRIWSDIYRERARNKLTSY